MDRITVLNLVQNVMYFVWLMLNKTLGTSSFPRILDFVF